MRFLLPLIDLLWSTATLAAVERLEVTERQALAGGQAFGAAGPYAKLRGRAVAGAKGLAGARIFCQKFEAELVAVADAYMSAEEIPPALRGKPAQIWLEDGQCKAAPL